MTSHIMKINNRTTKAQFFAYDGCHKIYLIASNRDKKEALDGGYSILPIVDLKATYDDSCELRFISDWKLTKSYANQFENAVFYGD